MKGIRRPLLCGCLILVTVIALWQRLADPPPWEPELPEELQGQQVTVTGQVYDKEVRTLYGKEILVLYLKSVTVSSDTGSGDESSVPNISERKVNDRLVCQLAAEQTVQKSVFAENEAEDEAAMPAFWERQTGLGSRVAVQGQLELYQHATNPGEWDSADYNLITHVAGRLKEASLLGSDNGRWPIRERLLYCRGWLKNRLYQALPQKEASVMARMLLGERAELDRELKELYQNNGIAHILAISGLHITLLGMSFYQLLRRGGCPIIPAAIAGGCMILFYGGLAGWGVSAVRAVGMYLIRMLGEVSCRRYDMLTAMGVLAAGMVCHNPRLVYHCGFLLSFGAVAGMGLIYPALLELPVCGRIEAAIRRKRLAAGYPNHCGGTDRGENRVLWENRGWKLLRSLLRGLLASLSVTLSTLPVQLYYFYQIPVYGTLLNLAVLPLMGPLLAGGLVLMALPAALPVKWEVMGILRGYERLCRLAEHLPGHLWITGCPEIWQIAGYYGILTVAVGLIGRNGGRFAKKETFAKMFLGREVCWRGRMGLLLLTASIILLTARRTGGFTFTMLDVGQGDCICVRTAQGQVYLFDGGSSSRSRVGEYVLIPYLKHQGIRTIDGIFLSHGDQDHIGAVRELLSDSEGIRLKVLYLPRVAFLPKQLEELRLLAQEAGCGVEYLSQGKGWQQGNFRLTCLWPEAGYRGDDNAGSACYLLEEKDFRALLTGDVEGEGERELEAYLKTMLLPGLDVLKVAHHGSRYSTTDTLLQTVTPRLALISAGRDNSYGHPHEETLERLEKAGCLYLQTADSGAITVRHIHNRIEVEKYR